MLAARNALAGKLRNALKEYEHILSMKQILIPVRVSIFRSLVVATGTYGGELFAGARKDANGARKAIINRGLSLAMGYKSANHTPTYRLRAEARLPTMHGIWNGARNRLLCKYETLDRDTWLSRLVKNPVGTGTWVSGARRARTTITNRLKRKIGITQKPTPQAIAELLTREEAKTTCSEQSFERYCNTISRCTKRRAWYPLGEYMSNITNCRNPGLVEQSLFQLRHDNFWTAERLARHDYIHEQALANCPCCNEPVPEDVHHMFLECSAWDNARDALSKGLEEIDGSLELNEESLELLFGGVNAISDVSGFNGSLWRNNEEYAGVSNTLQSLLLQYLSSVVGPRQRFLKDAKKEELPRADAAVAVGHPEGDLIGPLPRLGPGS